jgi:pimeloyl-ACP methyl ester carboxylesterase
MSNTQELAGRSFFLHRIIVACGLASACAGHDGGPAADASASPPLEQGTPAADVAPAIDAGVPPAISDGRLPLDSAKPAPCAASPLPLARFPAAQRTTGGGRVFTGWGGAAATGKAIRTPVVMVHGNGGDASDWLPLRDALCAAGYSDLELWAITFQDNSCIGACSSGSNTEHAEELAKLVELVRAQAGAARVTLIAVSMGVTTARYYIKALGGVDRGEVALAYLVSGPNHGLADCDVWGASYVNVACAELDSVARKSGWLHKLNNPDETPSGKGDGAPAAKTILYRTVSYLEDPFFPSSYVSSPKLEGADNLVLPGKKHAVIELGDLQSYLKQVP